MALKNLLVHVDTTPQCDGRLDLAVEFARQCDAHLTGVYVIPDLQIPSYIGPGYVPADLVEDEDRRGREAAKRAETAFEERMARSGLSVEWRCYQGRALDVLGLNARYADMTIMSQADPDNPHQAQLADLPAEVAMSSGRPTLVIPYIGISQTPGKHVMVAWNGSREATRALNDALPILKTAERVLVLAVNPSGGAGGHGEVPSADISVHLARHGVKAEAAKITADIEVGDAILSRISDTGTDLLVMGAYGHSRTRELILGGVTRDILRHMTVPVLLSH